MPSVIVLEMRHWQGFRLLGSCLFAEIGSAKVEVAGQTFLPHQEYYGDFQSFHL